MRPARAGTVYLVGAGPGDPDLLTVRAADLLASADTVAHDALISPEIVALIPAAAERIAVGRRCGDGDAGVHAIDPRVIERARAGRSVVRLKAGDPLVFGRGGEEAEALREAGIAFEIVPGISAALGAAAYTGIPLTHRRLSSSVTFATGRAAADEAGGGPGRGTLVLYMAAQCLEGALARARLQGWPPSTPAAAVVAATTPRQRIVIATVADLAARLRAAESNLTEPAIVIVGDVVTKASALAVARSCQQAVG